MEVKGRICNDCRIYKLKDNFAKHKKCKDGIYSICYECSNIRKRKYYQENKKDLLEKQRIKRNTHSYRAKNRLQQKQYRKNNPVKLLIMWARNKCKKRDIEFNLKEKDLTYTGICPVFNIKLEMGGENLDNSPTLDRIDPNKGYIAGNVQIICHLANRIKNNATEEQIKLILNYIEKCKEKI